MRAFGIAIVAAMALAGCSVEDDTKAAKEAVATFRASYAAAKYADIYNASAAELKGSITEAKFSEQLGAFHDALGNFKSAPEPGWTADTNGFVTLNYESTFDNAKAKEDFVFKMADGKATLAGYNIKTVDAPAAATGNEAAPANDAEADGEAEGG